MLKEKIKHEVKRFLIDTFSLDTDLKKELSDMTYHKNEFKRRFENICLDLGHTQSINSDCKQEIRSLLEENSDLLVTKNELQVKVRHLNHKLLEVRQKLKTKKAGRRIKRKLEESKKRRQRNEKAKNYR